MSETTDFGIAAASRAKLMQLFERTPGIQRVWIFGSRARGMARVESDIDLAIDAPALDELGRLRLSDAIEQLALLYKVDLVFLQDGLSEAFRSAIERERREFWAPRRFAADVGALGSVNLKGFQEQVLSTLDLWIDELNKQRVRAEQLTTTLRAMEGAEELAQQAGDFPKQAWAALRSRGVLPQAFAAQEHSSRFDGAGRAIPNACLKVPTGGGKTLLAAASVARIFGSYLARHSGLVLWVVPNEAIYRQTLKTLSDRDHPYRQMLNVAGAGRVKILEKGSSLNRIDVESQLCVMLLMLQSAARQSKETLRFFRDRGNVLGFLPREDDIEAHWALLQAVPNLDAYGSPWQSAEEARAQKGSIVKSSLGNVMRLVRPLVVIDEGQHAYTENALHTLDGFNPCAMLELSATPRIASPKGRGSNILVDVRGTDLDEAEMIKLPIRVNVRGWHDWQSCLGAAAAQIDALQQEADALQAETARYLRPILLVQVERTGADMRDTGFIHAEDAKAHLLQIGFTERQIAIKTSEKDELKQPENIDLLSPTCEVRAIITKQALQEGWDCPFAYVLCALAAGRNPAAMTQLVGRILRQPHVTKTGRAALDACYVLCYDADTAQVVRGIKKSLETEGMGDLGHGVVTEGGTGSGPQPIVQKRRDAFKRLRLFLPKVAWAEPGAPRRELVYDSDVLSAVDWRQLDPETLARDWAPTNQAMRSQRFDVGLELLERVELPLAVAEAQLPTPLDRARIVRALTDLAPNPWQAWHWVSEVERRLLAQGFSADRLARSIDTLIESLRADLEAERDRLAQAAFDRLVAAGRIEFRLRADLCDYELPEDFILQISGPPQALIRDDGQVAQKSLLEPSLRSADMNALEAAVAVYLDAKETLRWWHRNVAKAQYGLQGWRRDKVYPDFVFAHLAGDGASRMVLLETKGLHLQGPDTAYKQALLDRLSKAFRDERFVSVGELALEGARDDVVCDLVFDTAWRGVLEQRYFGHTGARRSA
ncbi:MAG: DEAD/DEAH box helicase family protein [Rubrivivax sp.]